MNILWRVILIYLIGLFFTELAIGQQFVPLSQYQILHWTTENGLPQQSVHTITQSTEGYLYFGTQEGLVRFDGIRFKVYDNTNTPELQTHFLSSLTHIHDGDIWMGSHLGGLYRLRSDKKRLEQINEFPSDASINVVWEDYDQRIWVGTEKGLYRLQGLTWNKISPSAQVEPIIFDLTYTEKGLYVATDIGLFLLNNDNWTEITLPGLRSSQVRSLASGKDSSLWIGTFGSGLYRIKNNEITRVGSAYSLYSSDITVVRADRKGAIWIGTWGEGLYRYTTHTERITQETGLASDVILSLFCDFEDNIWVGTSGGGLNKLYRGSLLTYGPPEGLPATNIKAIYEDHAGDLCIGTREGGWFKMRNQTVIEHHHPNNGFPSKYVFAITQDKNENYWIGTDDKGLIRYKSGKAYQFTIKDGISAKTIRALYTDNQDRIWVGTDGQGIFIYQNGKFTQYTQQNGLPSNVVRAFLPLADGSMLIGTSMGIASWNKNVISIPEYAHKHFDGRYILSLFQDSLQNIWVGTWGNGIFQIADKKVFNYNIEAGIGDNVVIRILADKKGYLWLSTNKGIYRISNRSLEAYKSGKAKKLKVKYFGTYEGMRSNECNSGYPAGILDKNNNIWFPTLKGIVRINPATIVPNPFPPNVHIEDVWVDDQFIPKTDPIIISQKSKKIEIHYTAFAYGNPNKVEFKYRFDNIGEDWIGVKDRREILFSNLTPGTYILRIAACNSDGLWNEDGDVITIVVPHFFYQTKWFIALCILLFILAGILYAKYSSHQNTLKRKELEVLVQDRTADLAKALQDLKLFQKTIEADNLRKTRELEDARRFQFAMLPKKIPNHPNFELNVWMQTATEVGGDYYDFKELPDNSFWFALGDATGHGLKSGFMVAAAKGYLQTIRQIESPEKILHELSVNIAAMSLRGMYIGMILGFWKDGKLTLSAGGMPPVWILRKDGNTEQFVFKALYLGSTLNNQFPYQTIELNTGDMLLCVTDGLHESVSPDGDMFEFLGIQNTLAKCQNLSTEETIEIFRQAIRNHLQNTDIQDDITILAIKQK
ncbi:MAG: SpoIIE family protein phosphatase [Bacteroidia bacterium]|nr:SpoIIE family protein phosphatase [Bacteroidia bacterium]